MLCKHSFTFLQYLPEHSSISRNRRTIPYLVFHLSLAFLHSKLRAFSSGNYNVRVVPTKSSLNVYQARYVITHNVVAWCVHLGHKPNQLIKNIVGKNLSMTQKYWNCALRRLTLFNITYCALAENTSSWSVELEWAIREQQRAIYLPPVRGWEGETWKKNKS